MRSRLDDAVTREHARKPERLKAAEAAPEAAKNWSEVVKLREVEVDLSGKVLDLRAEVATLSAGLGDAVVDAVLAGGKADDAQRPGGRESEVAALVAGIDAARARRRAGLEQRPAILAAELRKACEPLHQEIDGQDKRVARALERLEEVSGSKWIPAAVLAMPGVYVESDDGLVPHSSILAARLGVLEAEAAHLAGTKPGDSGTVTSRDRDSLLRQVLELPPAMIGPSVPAVLDWLNEAEPAVLQRRDRIPPQALGHGSPLVYYLVWLAGLVDLGRSRVIIPAVDRATMPPEVQRLAELVPAGVGA